MALLALNGPSDWEAISAQAYPNRIYMTEKTKEHIKAWKLAFGAKKITSERRKVEERGINWGTHRQETNIYSGSVTQTHDKRNHGSIDKYKHATTLHLNLSKLTSYFPSQTHSLLSGHNVLLLECEASPSVGINCHPSLHTR